MKPRAKTTEGWRTVRYAHVCISSEGQEPQLLLIRDVKPEIRPYPLWRIPGGSIQDGETPKKALSREFFEETGLALPECRIEFRNSRGKMARRTRALLSVGVSLEPLPIDPHWATDEVLGVAYFPFSALPLRGGEAGAADCQMDLFNFRLLTEAVRTNWRVLRYHQTSDYFKSLLTPP